MPTLSILTPSFNYAWCIEDALSSVVAAGERLPGGWDVQHVVVDDASSDGSQDLLERWSRSITLERLPATRGQAHALNRGLDLATGDWIGWLNADDFYLPWSFHDACITADDQSDVVHGDAILVDKAGLFMRLMAEHPFSRWTLRWWGTFLPVGVVFLRRTLLAQLRWREDLRLLLDWDLWLRAGDAGARFAYVPSPLVAVRRHPGQESRQERSDRLEEKSRVRRDHALPSRPWLWRAGQRVAGFDHAARKALSGGYGRQIRTRGLRASSMRWFDPAAGSRVDSLYRRGYLRRQPGVLRT